MNQAPIAQLSGVFGIVFGRDPGISAAIVEQRVALGLVDEAHDLADDDDMVAAVVDGVGPAFEERQRFGKYRAPDAAEVIADVAPFVLRRPREMGGNALLQIGQHVDREMLRRLEMVEGIAAPVQAEQQQRRIERNGTERIGGEADRLAAFGHGGDDGHAGREGPQRAPIIEGVPGGSHAFAPESPTGASA